ncbi:uncharacterized protein LOC123308202 isoform X2 [Coccinella septempunctata]|uniref:uncharacterized protein LOC123308202 isoform X2 n=1 Tax=Coccinella septempunctata TaxID=41139 RepID=UPI001D05EE40|nr:uncharacterized protein LOC123308202 isoform X2 [Coccinella septempunctata]
MFLVYILGSWMRFFSNCFFAIGEMFVGRVMDLVEVERAVVILHAFIFMAGAVMLLIGILVGDLVCIFLFVLFGFGALIAKVAAVVVFMIHGKRNDSEKICISLYACTLFVIHSYIILIAWSLGKKLWNQQHHNIQMSVRHHRWGHHRHHPVMGV